MRECFRAKHTRDNVVTLVLHLITILFPAYSQFFFQHSLAKGTHRNAFPEEYSDNYLQQVFTEMVGNQRNEQNIPY